MKIRSSVLGGVAFLAVLIGLLTWTNARRPGPSIKSDEAVEMETGTEGSSIADAAAGSAWASDQNVPDFIIPLPLSTIFTDAENGTWQRDDAYKNIPRGDHVLGGIPFKLEGMFQLQGIGSEQRRRGYRSAISVPLTVAGVSETNVGSVHLLGATRYESSAGTAAADLVWHYSDGTSRRSAIAYMNEIRDWIREPYENPARLTYPYSKVVWAEVDSQPARWRRLYRVSLANPEPAKPVTRLEWVSARRMATLFVIAITLDSMPPGHRMDASPDLEPGDLEPPAQLELVVQSAAGMPVSSARVRIETRASDRSPPARSEMPTDEFGIAAVRFPPRQLSSLDLSVSHDEHGGRKIRWNLEAGDEIPARHVLKLGGGVRIGGFVVDSAEVPIAGAQLAFHRFWSGGDDDPRAARGESPDFPNSVVMTDARGYWTISGLPEDLLHRIGFTVSHPEFLSTNFTVGNPASTEGQLRKLEFTARLTRGVPVRGRVIDGQNVPVAGATIWLGLRHYRERQEVTTAADGSFDFKKVYEGSTPLTVMARRFETVTTNIVVRQGLSEIVVQVQAGSLVRGRVQNEAGEPLPEARVGLDGELGSQGPGVIEFTTTTDQAGVFEWDSAPRDTMTFYIFATGYEAMRNVPVPPGEEKVITMRRARTIEGVVLDDATGQAVTNFNVRVGTRSGDRVYGILMRKEFNSPEGRFAMTLDEHSHNAILAAATGYADSVESFPAGGGGVIQLTIRMKSTGVLEGVVMTPDGLPSAGASVAMVAAGNDPGMNIQIRNGRIESHGSAKVAVTDANGRFKLTLTATAGRLAALGTTGFGWASLEEVRSNGKIQLQAFGRIEGTLSITGKPAAGHEMLFSMMSSGVMPDYETHQVKTDEQGSFTMERIPPGEGSIVRMIPIGQGTRMFSHQTPVTIEAGQTTRVRLGESGGVVSGNIRWETQPPDAGALVISGTLSSKMPPIPQFGSAEEARAFLTSPEFQTAQRERRTYAVAANADGSFTVDSITPGEYVIRVTATAKREGSFTGEIVAQGEITVTVPENAHPTVTLPVGDIVLRSMPTAPTPAPSR
ncbi:MAG TPA: carboxypeptidase regulatory-like domain-containing protein [Verrucomicrobiae bacterium]|nr:carboxypeptidase regulatory-like domain-containing protein [Verrucomicrobiae bacterium]